MWAGGRVAPSSSLFFSFFFFSSSFSCFYRPHSDVWQIQMASTFFYDWRSYWRNETNWSALNSSSIGRAYWIRLHLANPVDGNGCPCQRVAIAGSGSNQRNASDRQKTIEEPLRNAKKMIPRMVNGCWSSSQRNPLLQSCQYAQAFLAMSKNLLAGRGIAKYRRVAQKWLEFLFLFLLLPLSPPSPFLLFYWIGRIGWQVLISSSRVRACSSGHAHLLAPPLLLID